MTMMILKKLLFSRAVALLLLVATTTFVVTAAADEDVVRSIPTDLPFDENGKLAFHFVLYSQGCDVSSFKPWPGFETREVAGEAMETLFPYGRRQSSSCQAVCVERGVDRSVAGAVMPHKYYDSTKSSSADLATWVHDTCVRVEICLINYHSRTTPIKVYWFTETGEKKLHMEIKYGEQKTRCFSSFVGHTFQAEDGQTNQVLGKFTVEYITVLAFGESPPSADPGVFKSFDTTIESTLRNEWIRHNRVTRTFSPLGFKKGRLPQDVFASMGSFYYNNRYNKVREEWQGKGVFVNWWETEVYFIQIPWELKRMWQVRLRELVEAWAGVPVEQTDMYGLRQYESGARLLTHVDRHVTHAVSLIVNVAQGNLTEPWPVEVQDHADRLHEVIMEPGDIVYYESAKCLHGRNRPMAGPNAYYVNLFTHYRPIGDDEWFTKENHKGTPEPLMQVEGECRLEKVGTTETASHQLGVVEAVQCDDKRLGPYISPTLFTAANGEDLINWWRMTGPPPSQDDGSRHRPNKSVEL